MVAVEKLYFVQDAEWSQGGAGTNPGLQELSKGQQATMKTLAAEVARLSVAASGLQKLKAPDLTKEALEEFNKVQGQQTWMVSRTGLLK